MWTNGDWLFAAKKADEKQQRETISLLFPDDVGL